MPPGLAIADPTIHVLPSTAGADIFGCQDLWNPMGLRTVLSTPLLREGVAIGAIISTKTEIVLSQQAIKLLETFARPGCIVIDNAMAYSSSNSVRNLISPSPRATDRDRTRYWTSYSASWPTELPTVLDIN